MFIRRLWLLSRPGPIVFAVYALACSAAPSEHEGAKTYSRYCGLCHGGSGEGYAADNANALSNQDFLATVSDELLFNAIVAGRPGTSMSSFGKARGGPLDNDQAEELVSFIREWQQAAPITLPDVKASGSTLRGDTTYQVHCAKCHGENGGGETAMSIFRDGHRQIGND